MINKNLKKFVKIVSFLLIFLSLFIVKVEANETDFVYLGGDSIGIKMDTGVYVAGKYKVQTNKGKVSPWKNSNIEVGDKIEKINNQIINNNEDFQRMIDCIDDSTVNLTINRDNKMFTTDIDVVYNSLNETSIGLYIRDKILGIGTLTFVTPDYKFASLGHGIYDNNVLLNSVNGSLYYSNVSSIRKAEPGIAGEKRASISNDTIGQIKLNDITGLYGIFSNNNIKMNKIKVGTKEDVKIGKAFIYTTLSQNNIKKYDIEIVESYNQTKTGIKGMKIKLIDKELLETTGGIIQGMSGSPIVQNGQIIGAVSHVTVDNPTYGYGMYIDWMIDAANEI